MRTRNRGTRQSCQPNPADYIIQDKDRDGFLVKNIPPKGRGIFANQHFSKGEFLLNYAGKIITGDEGDVLEEEDSSGYRFFLKFNGKDYCIDATEEPVSGQVLGRLVNHGEKKEINVKVVTTDHQGLPALCLFALRDIKEGEELLYDYGISNLPWKVKSSGRAERRKTTSVVEEKGKPHNEGPLRDAELVVGRQSTVEATLSEASSEHRSRSNSRPARHSVNRAHTTRSEGLIIRHSDSDTELVIGQESTVGATLSDASSEHRSRSNSRRARNIEDGALTSPKEGPNVGHSDSDTELVIGQESTVGATLSDASSEHRSRSNSRRARHIEDGALTSPKEGPNVGRSDSDTELVIGQESTVGATLSDASSEHRSRSNSRPARHSVYRAHTTHSEGLIIRHPDSDTELVIGQQSTVGATLFDASSEHRSRSNSRRARHIEDGALTSPKEGPNVGRSDSDTELVIGQESTVGATLSDTSSEHRSRSNSRPARHSVYRAHTTRSEGLVIRHSDSDTELVIGQQSTVQAILFDASSEHRSRSNSQRARHIEEGALTSPKEGPNVGRSDSDTELVIGQESTVGATLSDAFSEHCSRSNSRRARNIEEGALTSPKEGPNVGHSDSDTELVIGQESTVGATLSDASSEHRSRSNSRRARNIEDGALTSPKEGPNVGRSDSDTELVIGQESTVGATLSDASSEHRSRSNSRRARHIEEGALTSPKEGPNVGRSDSDTELVIGQESTVGATLSDAFSEHRSRSNSRPARHSVYRAHTTHSEGLVIRHSDSDTELVIGQESTVGATLSDASSEHRSRSNSRLARHIEDGALTSPKEGLKVGHSDGDTELVIGRQSTVEATLSEASSEHCSRSNSRPARHIVDGVLTPPNEEPNIRWLDSDTESATEQQLEIETELSNMSSKHSTRSDSEDSGDEYVPDSDTDCNSDISTVIPLPTRLKYSSAVVKDCSSESSTTLQSSSGRQSSSKDSGKEKWQVSTTLQASSSRQNTSKDSREERSQVTVMRTNNSGARSYDKPTYCFVCMEPQMKLSVHIQQHDNDPKVAEWMAMKKGSEKDKAWIKLRNLGNHRHNYAVLEEGKGELIVVYRPSEYGDPLEYQPCTECLGYYSSTEFYRHKCKLGEQEPGESGQKEGKKRRDLLRKSRMLLPPPPGVDTGDVVHRLLGTFKADEVSQCIKGDELMLKVARKLCFKHGHDKEQFNQLRTKLRQVARLLLEFRHVSGNLEASSSDMLVPSEYEVLLVAVRRVSGFDDDNHLFGKPSLALKLGHILKKMAMLLVNEALIEGNSAKEKDARDVHTLLTQSWECEISSHALRTLYQSKRNNPKLLPLTSDVINLTKYLKERAEESVTKLKVSESETDIQKWWRELANITLTQVLLFNRKRQGEVSKLTIDDYEKITKGESHVLDLQMLSKFEQDLSKLIWRVEIVGKRGRTVPLLITEGMKEALDELMKYRQEAGVSSTNLFVFAIEGGSENHIRGSDTLRTTSQLSGAKRPNLLRSTQLRKHIAVMSQVMNLKDNELDVLANFLGHDVRVHREYYRLPDPAIQVAKVSKLLIALEGNSGSPTEVLHGKSLEELELQENEEIAGIDLDGDHEDHEDDNSGADTSEDEQDVQSEVRSYRGKRPPPTGGEGSRKKAKRTDQEQDSCNGAAKQRRNRGKNQKKPWTEREKAAVYRHFKDHIRSSTLPGKKAIEECLASEPCLSGRLWHNLKDFIRNKMKADARMTSRVSSMSVV